MDKYQIIKLPDPVLKVTAQPVERVDDAIRAQMDRMLKTMYEAPGIGLAANQVNLVNRVIVMDFAARDKDDQTKEPIFMANPEIIWESEEPSVWEEGCLSIPRQFADVERPLQVRVKYLDYNNQWQEGLFEGLGSHCVQHEIDHLNGTLFIDHLSTLKRNMLLRKYNKDMKERGDVL